MNKNYSFTTLKENRLFFYLMGILLSIGAFPLILWDKISFFILIKQWHHPIMDRLAPYLSYVGDGITYGCIVLVAILVGASYSNICIMAGSFGLMSCVVQLVFKRGFCSHLLRPTACIPLHALHVVADVKLEKTLTFPSGHAATIFVLASLIQLLHNKHNNGLYTFSLLLLAILVSYSRVYLCQHFYTDIYAGACIGTGASLLVYVWVNQTNIHLYLGRLVYHFIYRK
ncbi:MAG: phosphatase PAP2 family protein [Candidatus Cardinium sp.]|nr:phosphatase PAP2 family protein [Candidatus Cardinium sp.]